jgi:hypothetical protein
MTLLNGAQTVRAPIGSILPKAAKVVCIIQGEVDSSSDLARQLATFGLSQRQDTWGTQTHHENNRVVAFDAAGKRVLDTALFHQNVYVVFVSRQRNDVCLSAESLVTVMAWPHEEGGISVIL